MDRRKFRLLVIKDSGRFTDNGSGKAYINFTMKKPINNNLLPFPKFAKRVFYYGSIASAILMISLGIGIFGYHYIGELEWIDSLYNASMILTGMGPIDEMSTDAAKLFASGYALFSGVIFLSTVAIFFAPFAHRLMHLLHIESND